MVYGEDASLTMGRDVGLTPTSKEDRMISKDFLLLNLISSSSTMSRRTRLLAREDGKDVCAFQLLTRFLLLFIIL